MPKFYVINEGLKLRLLNLPVTIKNVISPKMKVESFMN